MTDIQMSDADENLKISENASEQEDNKTATPTSPSNLNNDQGSVEPNIKSEPSLEPEPIPTKDETSPPSTTTPRREYVPAALTKKDRTLREFLPMMNEYAPIVSSLLYTRDLSLYTYYIHFHFISIYFNLFQFFSICFNLILCSF